MNMRELLVGQNAKLRNVVRFSNCTRHHQETVAEHSWFMTFYAMVIGMELGLQPHELADVVQRGIVHDLEEAVSGDIHYAFKYSDPVLTKALKTVGGHCFSAVVEPLGLTQEDTKVLVDSWERGKSGDNGDILKLADRLSTVGYVCREIRAGNVSIKDECLKLREALHELECYPRIRPYIRGALSVMTEVGL